jgi:hypothetical protein
MRFGSILGAALLLAPCGCAESEPEEPATWEAQDTAVVSINYRPLRQAADGAMTSIGCKAAGVDRVRLLVGDDDDGDGALGDAEVRGEAIGACSSAGGIGVFPIEGGWNEGLGRVTGPSVPVGTYDIWAVEFLDERGDRMSWKTSTEADDSERASFRERFRLVHGPAYGVGQEPFRAIFSEGR